VFDVLVAGGKTAIGGYNTEIDEMLTELKAVYTKTTFFRGKENIAADNKFWSFSEITYSQPYIELVQLMAAGIYQFWRYWIRDRKLYLQTMKEETTPPQPLSIRSSTCFIFIILTLGLVVSVAIFLSEFVPRVIRTHSIRQRLNAAWQNSILGFAITNPKTCFHLMCLRLRTQNRNSMNTKTRVIIVQPRIL